MENIENRFNQIALTTENFAKQQMILDLLVDFNPEYIEGMGIIIRGGNKVIVSHFDLVSPFERGFEEGRTIIVTETEVIGALDNTITNAILINNILEFGIPEDTTILFTDFEETGLRGMAAFMKSRNDIEDLFFINLDVTDDNWDFNCSIEYDHPNIAICKEINNGIGIEAGFTDQRFTDDLSAVIYNGGDGFSYCLPTKEYCHTYKSNTTVEKTTEYAKGLHYLVQDFRMPEVKTPTPKGMYKITTKGKIKEA